MRRTRLCSLALRSLTIYLHKRDAVFMTSEAAPLPSRPLNHLSVLAYLAIGIVVFASSVVTGYLIHSCYRSATRKDATGDFSEKSSTVVGVDAQSDRMVYRRTTGRRDLGEVGLTPLAREFRYDDESFLSSSDSRVYFPEKNSKIIPI
jgi:hypothetical protein